MTDVALALLRRGDRWFLQRRDPANAVLPGLWEFPGGKVEAGETPEVTLRRELLEEVGLNLCEAWPWPVLEGPIRLHPFLAGNPGRAPHAVGLPMPPRNADLVARLAAADLIG